MRGEADDHLLAGGEREFLIEFGHVPVTTDAIGVEAFRHFGEQHRFLRRAPGAGHPGLGVDHDPLGLDRLVLQKRHQRQLRAGGVAAGIGDQPRLPDVAPVDFGQPVDRFGLKFRRVMLVPVPARVSRDIAQPEIRRQIDDLRVRRVSQQLLQHLLRGGMRQRAEDEIERLRLPVEPLDRDQLLVSQTARIAETRCASPARPVGRR